MQIDPSLQNMLSELGQHLSVGEVRLDAEARCAFRFGGRMTINLRFHAPDDQFCFYADLGAPAPSIEIYRDLLGANLFWRGASGATLSLSNDDPPHVILAQIFGWRGRTGAQFAREIETFANVAQDWAETLSGGSESGQTRLPQLGPEFTVLIRV